MQTKRLASQICGIRRSLAGLEIGLIPMEIYRSNDEYHVTGVELNYGRVKLPVTSVNFIKFIKLSELTDRVAEFV